MKERDFNKICLAGSLFSLVAIYIVSLNINTDFVNICEINENYINRNVKVNGTVSDVRDYRGNIFFKISNGKCKIRSVIWADTLEFLKRKNEGFEIKNGCNISISGTVKFYKGMIEIIPNRGNVKLILC